MARAAHHFTVRKPKRARRGAHRLDAVRVETRRREVVDLLQIAFKAKVAGNGRRRVAKLTIHRCEMLVAGMPHVDGHLDDEHLATMDRELRDAAATIARDLRLECD